MKNLILRVAQLLIVVAVITSAGFSHALEVDWTGWENAKEQWLLFADEHMSRMKEHDATLPLAQYDDYEFDMKWSEVKSPLIDKYLPGYKIFSDTRFVFSLDKKGNIICFGQTWPLNRPFKTTPNFSVQDYGIFLKNLYIPVNDAETAVEMAKLWEIVLWGVTDAEIEEISENWKYNTAHEGTTWVVQKEYTGPPASIMMQPSTILMVNEHNHLIYIYLGM